MQRSQSEKLDNFIDGRYVPPQSGSYFENYEPATGRVYSHIADSSAGDVEAAVVAAQRAFKTWSKTTAQDRSKTLHKIANLIEKNLDVFAVAESRDQGKPVWLARTMDIPRAVENFRFFAGAILHHTNLATHMNSEALNYVLQKPHGVVGLISPWNLPLYLLTWKIAPALATGNCVVCKPSELTSMTAFLLGDIFNEAGVPPGVCNIVLGLGSRAGDALVTHPDVPAISFTGGTVTAKTIIQNSAAHYKKLSLELGGKNPNLIFADTDFEKCLKTTLRSSFLNQGEICLCGSRIFVEEKFYPQFIEKFVAMVNDIVVGDPQNEKSFMGALVSSGHLQKVQGFIDKARTLGGDILTGGERPVDLAAPLNKGYFLRPTVIAGLSAQSEVMQEEIFGPVVTVTPFKNDDEAIALANGVRYGLSASVWTSDINRAHKLSRELDVGQVWVNTWMKRDLRVPFGGVKHSGIGREGGVESLDFYTEKQNICIAYGAEG